MRNPGMMLQLEDGRKGIAYRKEQVHKDKLTIKMVDNNWQPVISGHTGKQAIVFRSPDEIKIVGYVD